MAEAVFQCPVPVLGGRGFGLAGSAVRIRQHRAVHRKETDAACTPRAVRAVRRQRLNLVVQVLLVLVAALLGIVTNYATGEGKAPFLLELGTVP
jgi:hypothetical protein